MPEQMVFYLEEVMMRLSALMTHRESVMPVVGGIAVSSKEAFLPYLISDISWKCSIKFFD
jgi:hypothetical protein